MTMNAEEKQHIEEVVHHSVAVAMLEREQRLTLGRKDWLQMVGLLVMLLCQTVYVTVQWSELKAGIQANTTAIEVRTEDRYTRTEAKGSIDQFNYRIGALEEREAKLEILIQNVQQTNREVLNGLSGLRSRVELLGERLKDAQADRNDREVRDNRRAP